MLDSDAPRPDPQDKKDINCGRSIANRLKDVFLLNDSTCKRTAFTTTYRHDQANHFEPIINTVSDRDRVRIVEYLLRTTQFCVDAKIR